MVKPKSFFGSKAGRGVARYGKVGQGLARLGVARQGKARRGEARDNLIKIVEI